MCARRCDEGAGMEGIREMTIRNFESRIVMRYRIMYGLEIDKTARNLIKKK